MKELVLEWHWFDVFIILSFTLGTIRTLFCYQDRDKVLLFGMAGSLLGACYYMCLGLWEGSVISLCSCLSSFAALHMKNVSNTFRFLFTFLAFSLSGLLFGFMMSSILPIFGFTINRFAETLMDMRTFWKIKIVGSISWLIYSYTNGATFAFYIGVFGLCILFYTTYKIHKIAINVPNEQVNNQKVEVSI